MAAGLIAGIIILASGLPAAGQGQFDPRNIENGSIIPDEDWGEQPLIVKLQDGRWFCVLTTGRGKEGSDSQHIVYTISSDKGKTWMPLRDIEPA
ncbi:MAG: glycoside hydrolase, partial [Octadecabacter sp.]|nr:glycoside hydrolase [Octadecabacter sp.]